MQADTSTKKTFFLSHRSWILLLGIILFMPPLSLLVQFTQDSNFCGTWCPRMFFSWRHGESAAAFLQGVMRNYLGVALVLGVLGATFFRGRIWCSHICPVGGTTELGSRLFPSLLKIPLDRIPAAPVRYGYLTAYLLLPALGLGSLCCGYCNFATLPRFLGAFFSPADLTFFLRSAGLINLGLLLGFGFLSRGGRGYCNLLCPVGALDALSNRAGMKNGRRMRILEERCNGCSQCKHVCPVWAIGVEENKATIDQLSCVPCGLCRNVCMKDAIVYGTDNSSKKDGRTAHAEAME